MSFGKIFILGDSYSTFAGYIPKDNSIYYPRKTSDVKTVDDTWWKMLLNESDAVLTINDSWSGTTICNTGYNDRNCSDNSFIARFEKRLTSGFFKENRIDTAIVFGGTNDNWANSPVGNIKYEDISEEDKFSVLPGFSYLISKILQSTDIKKIIVIINEGLKAEISDGIFEISRHYGAYPLRLKGISKTEGHPDRSGMIAIKDQRVMFENKI